VSLPWTMWVRKNDDLFTEPIPPYQRTVVPQPPATCTPSSSNQGLSAGVDQGKCAKVRPVNGLGNNLNFCFKAEIWTSVQNLCQVMNLVVYD